MPRLMLLLLSCSLVALNVNAALLSAHTNPIRRVVTLLQKMQVKITREGQEHKDMFEKLMCYCKKSFDFTEGSLSDANDKIPQLESSLQASTQDKNLIASEVTAAKKTRSDAAKTLTQAADLRTKGEQQHAEEAAQLKADIAALTEAIEVLQKATKSEGSFLQSSIQSVLQRLSVSLDMPNSKRDVLTAFLSGASGAGYQPQSHEIIGILMGLKDGMEQDLAKINEEEAEAEKTFEILKAAKEEEIAVQTKSIEQKDTRVGDLSVEIASEKNDFDDTKESLEEDQEFFATTKESCTTASKDFDAYQKAQAEELKAIADVISILNEDDALELFKKTLTSSASFLQLRATSKETRRRRILKELRARRLAAGRPAGREGDQRFALIELAIRGGKVGFEEVLKMIDELVVALKKEQGDDDDKLAYCEKELQKADDAGKKISNEQSFLEKVMEEHKETISALETEIGEKAKSIEDLDKQVEKATATRKEEHDLYVKELAMNNAAKELLETAKERLFKFYGEKTDSSSAGSPSGVYLQLRRARLEDDASLTQEDDDSLTQEEDLQYKVPKYKKFSEGGASVTELIHLLLVDITREVAAMETEEKDAQADYEKMLAAAESKRKADSEAMSNMEGTKAEKDEEVIKTKEKLKLKKAEKKENDDYAMDVHKECDWLIEYHGLRKQAREAEVESLQKAKAIFSGAKGADFSFVQTGRSTSHLRGVRRATH